MSLKPFQLKYSLLWWSICIVFVLRWMPLPTSFYEVAYSRVLLSAEGEILSARVATDGQWRLPPSDTLAAAYEQTLLLYEDQYFYRHLGINPVSMAKAAYYNLKNGKRRGGSTITLQLARILHGNKSRTFGQKLKEVATALTLELRYSKTFILQEYAARAPFGKNIVGIRAASYRYFNRPPEYLSLAEAAALAVLPNAPGLIYPGSKRAHAFKVKRDFVLKKMWEQKIINEREYHLSMDEPLPSNTFEFQDHAPHANEKPRPFDWFASTLSSAFQIKMQAWVNEKSAVLAQQGVQHMALMVWDLEEAQVLVYVGNKQGIKRGDQVNMVEAPRSVGSLLKPFLYGKALDVGLILPSALLADLPKSYGSYTPRNFDEDFFGAWPADQCLAESRNLPFVDLLQIYNLDRFYTEMQRSGLPLPHKADYYGLAYILGGVEASMFYMSQLYRNLWAAAWQKKQKFLETLYGQDRQKLPPIMSSLSAQYTLAALQKHPKNPGIAYKTGTSFGHRDAWAIGLDSKHLVALWCGNAHNESIEGLTGVSYAVPLMKEVFDQLSIRPLQVLPQAKQTLQICASSGYRASHFCKPGEAISAVTSYFKSPQCRLCQPVAVDSLEEFRYVDNCITGYYKLKNYFVLPPAMEYFYVKKNNSYPYMPPLHPNCVADHQIMEIISPAVGEKIFLPKKLDGSKTYVVIKAYHRIKNERITWFVNGTKLGETHAEHQWALPLEAGDIQVTLLDSKGHYLDHTFQVLERF